MAEIEFYTDKVKKTVNPELFWKVAEDLAKKMAGEDSRSNKRSQLRKFYDEVQRLNQEARGDQADWSTILPYVHMLVAKVAYAKGRNLVTEGFSSFIRTSINQVKDKKDLDVFASVFEAFMGFYKLHRPND